MIRPVIHRPIGKHPPIKRTLALTIPPGVDYGKIMALVSDNAGEFMTGVSLVGMDNGGLFIDRTRNFLIEIEWGSIHKTLRKEDIVDDLLSIRKALEAIGITSGGSPEISHVLSI